MTTPQDAPAGPVPCFDRPRCRGQERYLVECGTYGRGGHLIGGRSCVRHLGETVAYAATRAQPVRVLDLATATAGQRTAARTAIRGTS